MSPSPHVILHTSHFISKCSADHLDLHSFPTRRSPIFVNVFSHIETNSHITGSFKRLSFSINRAQPTSPSKSELRTATCESHTVIIRLRLTPAISLAAIADSSTVSRLTAARRTSSNTLHH